MRPTFRVSLLAACLLIAVGQVVAEDEKKPDEAKKEVLKLLEQLSKEQDFARIQPILKKLGPDGPYAKVAIPLLIEALDETKTSYNTQAESILADYGSSAVASLVLALKSPEVSVKTGAVYALAQVRPKPNEVVPALIDALKDSAPEVRRAAAYNLCNFGRSSDKTVPALIAALSDDNNDVREGVLYSLRLMGRKAEPAVPHLITALKNPQIRSSAAWDLYAIGPGAKAAVPALLETLKNDKDPGVRKMIVYAFGGIGPEAKEAVPALIEVLKEPDLLDSAVYALGAIGPNAKAAVPELIKLAKNKKYEDRYGAIRALGKIGPSAKTAVPTMIGALAKGKYSSYPGIAAEALGGIGPDAKDAVPALMALARDLEADSFCREEAAHAVAKIDPDLAAKEKMEFAFLNIRLGKISSVKLEPGAALTETQKKRIKSLIAKLAEIKEPDYGMAMFNGRAFAAVPGQANWQGGLLTGETPKTSEAFRSLVANGPDALPFLLDALDDNTPTKLKVCEGGFPALTGFETSIRGNPLNPLERRVLLKEETRKIDVDDDLPDRPPSDYRLRVGDVCFVAIGQIVGRPYSAVRYIPSGMASISSPVEKKELRDKVRAIWSSDDSAKKVLDSLLLDYATEGLFNGSSEDGWSEGSDFQIQAVLRLLYYFPKETAPLIATRLRLADVMRKDIQLDWIKQDVKNGVRMIDFIKAVSWCQEPSIQEALADIAKRTDDPRIKEVLPAAKKK